MEETQQDEARVSGRPASTNVEGRGGSPGASAEVATAGSLKLPKGQSFHANMTQTSPLLNALAARRDSGARTDGGWKTSLTLKAPSAGAGASNGALSASRPGRADLSSSDEPEIRSDVALDVASPEIREI